LLAVVGAVLTVIEVIAILDPVGTKMADDGNPFGPVAPWWVHVFWAVVIFGCFLFSFRLLRRGKP
jgi:hypothetical protein